MSLKELGEYTYWCTKSPGEILKEVESVGGWTAVFPKNLPLWAHRVRNYFNYEPLQLVRLSEDYSEYLMRSLTGKFSSKWSKDGFVQRAALSGDVYKDHNGKFWYQMTPGGTIYHYGSEPKNPMLEAMFAQLKGQGLTPIFKLVSPNNLTGGSCETIILNKSQRTTNQMAVGGLTGLLKDNRIGSVGVPEYVFGRLVDDDWYQGSYNYAETVVAGNPAHEKYDVLPHKNNIFKGVYVNPPQRRIPPSNRIFPEKAPGETKPLAEQL